MQVFKLCFRTILSLAKAPLSPSPPVLAGFLRDFIQRLINKGFTALSVKSATQCKLRMENPSGDGEIQKKPMWPITPAGYYSTIKRDGVLIHTLTRLNLENMILSERS